MSDDYVKRSDVHKVFQPKYAPAINKTFAAMIDSVPAADVVEVVRCCECVMARKPNRRIPAENRAWEGTLICSCGFEHVYPSDGEELIFVDEYFYCADGKHKDGGQEDV